MIQLSSPAPESLPVLTGKSPEKAALSTTGDGRFEKALDQSRQISRNERSSESEGGERRKVSLRTEKGSKENRKSESASRKSSDSEPRTAAKQNGIDESGSDKDGITGSAVKNPESGETLLSLGKHKSRLAAGKTVSGFFKKSGTVTGATGENTDAVSAALISSETLIKKSADLPVSSEAEQSVSAQAAGSPAAESALLTAADGNMDAESAQGNVLTAALSDKEASVSLKASRLSRKKSANPLTTDESGKITVDDRRTSVLKDEGVVLKKVEHNSDTGSLTLEMTGTEEELPGMMLRSDDSAGSAAKFSLQTAEESKGAALLDRQLKNEGTAELTKNIRFVLKDNNEGEIKLILKPEALGKVRINLNLNENNIVGKIIVENNSVRQVFMNNLADLTRALEDSGFNSAALDVSVGGGQSEGRGAYRDERPVYFTDNALDDLEDMIPVVYDEGHSLSQINLVV